MPYKDPEKRRENQHKYYQEFKEAFKLAASKWWKNHPEAYREKRRRWRGKHREAEREYQHRYYLEHTLPKRRAKMEENTTAAKIGR